MKNNGLIWLLVSVILLGVTLILSCQSASVEPELSSPTVQAPAEEVYLTDISKADEEQQIEIRLPVCAV